MIFLRGLLLGLAIAAPVGPIGILCIRRTLAYGRMIGFVTGLGAATADMAYAAISAFGLTAIAVIFTRWSLAIHLIGAILLIYLGLSTFFMQATDPSNTDNARLIAVYEDGTTPNPADAQDSSGQMSLSRQSMRSNHQSDPGASALPKLGRWGAYGSTVALTLTNPATILSFTVIFAGLGLLDGNRQNNGAAAAIVLGVFCGSAIWWFLLSGGIALFRARLTSHVIHWINRASGAIFIGFAVLSLVSIRP